MIKSRKIIKKREEFTKIRRINVNLIAFKTYNLYDKEIVYLPYYLASYIKLDSDYLFKVVVKSLNKLLKNTRKIKSHFRNYGIFKRIIASL